MKHVNRDLKSDIGENVRIEVDKLREEVQNQRLDMIFERKRLRNRTEEEIGNGEEAMRQIARRAEAEMQDEKMIEIIEFSYPYEYMAHERNRSEQVYEEK
jgi:hypothetical protein